MTEPTASPEYAARLGTVAWWKRIVPVQAPYRWNLRRLRPGRTLDVGCGTGRNLRWLPAGSVGIDHNPGCVAACRAAGLSAVEPSEFAGGTFDTLLLSHVVEHLEPASAAEMAQRYARCIRPRGRIVVITPQEAGYASDPTHVRFVDFTGARALVAAGGGTVVREYSFPFPRVAGRWFPYNEFVVVGALPG